MAIPTWNQLFAQSEAGDVGHDPLAELLVPRVLAGIAEATVRLESLRARLRGEADAITGVRTAQGASARMPRSEEPWSELDEVGEHVERWGWCLAVLASGEGMDLVMERREEQGVVHVLDLLGRALGEYGCLLSGGGAAPRLSPRAPDGWRLPWAWSSCLLMAARDRPRELRWELEPSRESWRVRMPGHELVARYFALRVGERLPGARLIAVGDQMGLEFPRSWLR